MPSLLRARLRALRCLNFPGALLIALLQRTPVLRVLVATDEFVAASPAGALLRSAFTAAGTLGAIHTLAGASTGPVVTQLVADRTQPATGTTGSAFSEKVSFYNPSVTIVALSWSVDNTLPPGVTVEGGTVQGNKILANTPTGVLTLSGVPTTAGTYTVNITGYQYADQMPPSTSATATIVITQVAGSAPSFTLQPKSQSVDIGTQVTLSASVTATPAPTYQWQKDGANVAGATSNILVLSNVQLSDAGNYTLAATNSAGTTNSQSATLTVTDPNAAPAFTQQPLPQTVEVGARVTLTAAANGVPAPTLRWQKDGVDLKDSTAISGSSTGTLVIAAASAADAGAYTAIATNGTGATTSSKVQLTVNPAPIATDAAWLTNVSVRTTMRAGQVPLIVGFAVSGGAKNILVRAAGPALAAAPFNIAGTIADPQLQLYPPNATAPSYSNDNWDPTLAATFASVQAFPFPAGSKDAAFVQNLSGAYTVQAPATGPGMLLVEAYDTAYGQNSPRLVNLSARNRVGTGADVLIAGFSIAGNGTKRLLIRGVGPKLADFGVTDYLPDPVLAVYSGQTEIAANDNWDASLASTFAAVYAQPLTPGSKDAAVVVPLTAGQSYTVQVSGANGGTGQALVEVYEVP